MRALALVLLLPPPPALACRVLRKPCTVAAQLAALAHSASPGCPGRPRNSLRPTAPCVRPALKRLNQALLLSSAGVESVRDRGAEGCPQGAAGKAL